VKRNGRHASNGKVYPPLSKREYYKVEWVPIDSVKESPENEDIYGRITEEDEQMDMGHPNKSATQQRKNKPRTK
jgi:hypothetical protein